MLGFLGPVRRTAAVAAAIVACRIASEVAAVAYLRPVVTSLTQLPAALPGVGIATWFAEARPFQQALLMLAATQIGLIFFVYMRPIWDAKLSMHAMFHMRELVFDRLQHCGFSLHDRMSSGKLINRALSDLQTVNAFINMALLNSLDIVLSIAAYVALLLACSLWLGAVLGVAVPVGWWVIHRLSARMQESFFGQQEASDQVVGALTEAIHGVQVVRSFGREPEEMRRYQEVNDRLLVRLFAVIRLQAKLVPRASIIASTAHVLMFALTCMLIGRGRMQLGDLMVLGVAMGTIVVKMQSVNLLAESYRKATVSAQRLFEILDSRPEIVQALPAVVLNPIGAAEIRFERVVFGYEPGRPVLREIDLMIPGEKVTAIVGATGAGKSTLVAMIGRFYDPWSGRISIDGQDLRHAQLDALRHLVGYVFQETFLFSDTVRNNLRYGRLDVTEGMLVVAAKAAQAHDFIESLPQGYDTMLGEKGVLLSGGQRQRLALARALVYDPRILVLDDATAALDARTEQTLHAMVAPLLARRTVLVIAHRLTTVRHADFVVVLAAGQVVETGNHDELLAKGGCYCDLLRSQLDSSFGGLAPETTEVGKVPPACLPWQTAGRPRHAGGP